MLDKIATFFDHSRHKLSVHGISASLDVLAFTGEEHLSQPFRFTVEFTSTDHDIGAEQMLGKDAHFTLHAAPHLLPIALPGLPVPEVKPLRTLHGVITAFKRLSGSNDETRYEVALQPRMALLARGRQYRIYQHQSVPQIVESLLRSRHGFEGQDFVFTLTREYPQREQVMQYGESDLAFITRLLAEVGIWYRFNSDDRLRLAVVEFHDDQRHYLDPRIELPYRTQSGLGSSGQDGVWQLQASHQVVEKSINFRAYHARDAKAWLDGEVDQTRGAETTYGEAYHYAEPYTVLGDKLDQDEDLQSESGYFYGRLRHERYLNQQTCLSGVSSSPTLALAHVLTITGGAPQAFAPGAVIISLITRAARDCTFEARFEAIPYSETVCFRPPLQAKPQIAGTLPARVTSAEPNDLYSHIDKEGRYKVSFLFDRDSWKPGMESMWLRLARPYAGDTHGLHLPLICGTEVAIAFEQGDPDRPYIAHALHDSRHPDHVTLARRDYKRNVLRTPANNKLRMEDERGQEHIKLSTEHSGKSQLNLGHLVNAKKEKRGEGFELRTDGWGAIRGGKGLFISADQQPQGQGDVLDMNDAVAQLQQALELVHALAQTAAQAGALHADVQAQQDLKTTLTQLKGAGLLASAPDGIALSTQAGLQLSADKTITTVAGDSADTSVFKRYSVSAGDAISLFALNEGINCIAGHGSVVVQAQSDDMLLQSNTDLTVESCTGEIVIHGAAGITLMSGGAYIKLKEGNIEIGATGDIYIKNDHIQWGGAASLDKALKPWALDDPKYIYRTSGSYKICDEITGQPMPYVPYRINVEDGRVLRGMTDIDGNTQTIYSHVPVKSTLHEDYDDEPEELEEEEEEEEETEEGITLRLGLFFDGTGNNQSNAAATERCRETDLMWYTASDLESLQAVCKKYGFTDFDGEGFNTAPDNSYGNAASNVAHLYRLYPDNTAEPMKANAAMGYVSLYIDGIGTRSGGEDATLFGQGLGQGETGVVARVEQAADSIGAQLRFFGVLNPGTRIQRIEVDIFGFSRGAAAARHCANEFLKPNCGVFREALKPGRLGLSKRFKRDKDVCLNLIGLFDTVAAISNPLRGDFSPANDINHGVNLHLPPGCARQVVQLYARDEYRANFALNGLESSHLQIGLPGAHSDVGGGYRPRAQEKLWLTAPRRASVPDGENVESHRVWALVEKDAEEFRKSGIAGEGKIVVKAWPVAETPLGHHGDSPLTHDHWITVVLERHVRGELSLIALRVMRELGIRHGVPFKTLEARPQWALPDELKAIAERMVDQVMSGTEVTLEPDQESLLRARYIHQSAHWTPTGPFLLGKPAPLNSRFVHADQPQKGYPE